MICHHQKQAAFTIGMVFIVVMLTVLWLVTIGGMQVIATTTSGIVVHRNGWVKRDSEWCLLDHRAMDALANGKAMDLVIEEGCQE